MTWILIDGNNWFARDFFASKDNAGVTFKRRLHDLLEQVDHSRCAIAWDARTSFRHELIDTYKSGRAAKPDGFHGNLNELRNDLATIDGVSSLEVNGFEADDLLATLARQAQDEGEQAIIFSTDKDLHQCLVAGWVSQVTQVSRATQRRLSFVTMTAKLLFETTGVHPWQWIDFRTIVGDKSDNLSGCPGLGEKVAAEVLSKCKTLDRFYDKPFVPNLNNRRRSMLLEFRSQVDLQRRLVTLVDSAPLPATWLEKIPL